MIGAGTITYKGSRVWRFWEHPLYSASALTIDWETLFSDLPQGTKHQREYLKVSAKELMYELILFSESRVGRLSPGTVMLTFMRLRCLIKWMVTNNVWRFNLLTATDCLIFLQSRVRRKGLLRGENVLTVTNRVIDEYVTLMENMWILRAKYTSPLRFSPKPIEGVTEIISQCRETLPWKPLQISEAIQILSSAFAWQRYYTIIFSIEEVSRSERTKWVGITKKEKVRRSKLLYGEIEASDHGRLIRQITGDQKSQFSMVYAEAVRCALSASMLIILLFSGMRIGEVLSLRRKCLEQIRHSDGQMYWYANGIAGKKNGMRRKWIMSAPAVEAIKFVEELARPLKDTCHDTPLFLIRRGGTNTITHSTVLERMKSATANKLLRYFIKNRVDAESSLASKFHAHRARKTFARFVTLRDKRALESLAHHYGHLYAAFLDQSYVGTDFDLTDLLREENEREMREGLTSLLNATAIGGKAGSKLMEFRDSQVSQQKFRGKLALKSMVDKLLNDGVILAPCDWGYCVYAKDLSMCKGSDVAPSIERRSPSVCASCSNFAVTEVQLSWWERRYNEQELFLRKELPDQTRRVVENQFTFTQKILTDLVCKDVKKSK